MSQGNTRLSHGDLVEVRAPDEILQSLDAEGASDNLPFMPEMLQFCGQTFRVASRALTICFSGPGTVRGFPADDVVTLQDVRCTGAAHDGCQKACIIFWREAWLRKVDNSETQSQIDLQEMDRLRARLKVTSGPKVYYCQASELSKSTYPLSYRERVGRYFSGLSEGNFTAPVMAMNFATWMVWRIRRMVLGAYGHGVGESTPIEGLNLQPGEWVEVKSMQSITATLNQQGRNRGLYFSPDMRLLCGKRYRVKGRLDKLIADGTGEMRHLRNTVSLEGSTCGCSYIGFGMGGCSRCEITYWRESWLRRSDDQGHPPASEG
jgi:hypothetical protein